MSLFNRVKENHTEIGNGIDAIVGRSRYAADTL